MRPLALLAAALVLALATAAPAAAQGPSGDRPVASGTGTATVDGRDVIVDVVVAVKPGQSRTEAVREALRDQGARPRRAALGSQGFQLIGVPRWDGATVDQRYNPAGEPFANAGNLLDDTYTTWENDSAATPWAVDTTVFDFTRGSNTSTCPSLVRECPGPQEWDDENGVGWVRMDPWTLGVTYIGDGPFGLEADMALNTRVRWNEQCNDDNNGYSAESVLLHENGHVLGLDHSVDDSAVMGTYYTSARCTLTQDDQEGVTYLYPTYTTTVSGTVTDASTSTGIGGATVTLDGTQPLLQDATSSSGDYSVAGVPRYVTYDITATATDYTSETQRVTVDGAEDVDFALNGSGGGGDDGGGGGPCHVNPDHWKCQG